MANFISLQLISLLVIVLILFSLAPKQTSLALVSCIFKDNGSTQTELTMNSSKGNEALSRNLHSSLFRRKWIVFIN